MRHARKHRSHGRLQSRIFWWFGATIWITAVFVYMGSSLISAVDNDSISRRFERLRNFAAGRFERVWSDAAARDELAGAAARDLEVDITLEDANGKMLSTFGAPCTRQGMSIPVPREGPPVGRLHVCVDRHRPRRIAPTFAGVVIGLGMIWAASRAIARRLTRPIVELTRVAEDLGAGRLSSRAQLRGHHGVGEIGTLSLVMNDMAGRIERQLADQRALMAAVSHEIRTPLARMRLVVEMARDGVSDPVVLDKIDREVTDIDSLVSDLLASSRIDFSALAPVSLDAATVAVEALERAEEPVSKLVVEAEGLKILGDPTLVARALQNVVANAKTHGGGVSLLRIREQDGHVVFEVEDEGEGFVEGEEARIFEPFYRGTRERKDVPSVGLGLSLVRKIAEAHGGTAYARNRAPKGAVVAIELKAS